MIIESVWVIDFRNFKNQTIEFSTQQNLLIGPNGSGKTNILEAIDIIATTKSKRVKGINHCICVGQKGFIITVNILKDGEQKQFVFRQEKGVKRIIKVDDEILEKSSSLLGLLNCVIFLPEDIELLKGSPQTRRKYLDILISQLNPEYYQSLKKYQLNLKQRNELLKNIRDSKIKVTALDIWDKQLVTQGTAIFLQREKISKKLNKIVQEYFKDITNEKIKLVYQSDFGPDVEQNIKRIKQSLKSDIMFGHTQKGIHGDDLLFMVNNTKKVVDFYSQGQQRLISVLIKFAEAILKKEILADDPILLIDDVLLELDLETFDQVLKKVLPNSQKIYTVTDTKRFSAEALSKFNEIKISEQK